MAFETYADLKNAVALWVNRDNQVTVDRVPDFIRLGENRIFRQLRSRWNEKKLVFPIGGGNENGITLPDDFKEIKYLLWDGRILERRSDQYFFSQQNADTTQSTPLRYARTEALKIEFWPPPDNDAEVVLYYYNQQGPISDSLVPELYLRFPELYLFGALLEAEPFLKSKDLGEFWRQKYQEVFAEAQDDTDEAEFAGSTVEVTQPYPDNDRVPRNIGLY